MFAMRSIESAQGNAGERSPTPPRIAAVSRKSDHPKECRYLTLALTDIAENRLPLRVH